MLTKTTEAVGRAWKFDNKWIWSALVLVGSLLGYSIPESLDLPFATHAEVKEAIEAHEATYHNSVVQPQPEPSFSTKEEAPATPAPTKRKINVEGY